MQTGYLQDIIDRLGYRDAEGFYLYDEIPFEYCSVHDRNVLEELKPAAVYMPTYKPFVCFFDLSANREFRKLGWKIWNAQIDIAICVSEAVFEVYYGKTLSWKKQLPQRLEAINFRDVRKLPFAYMEIKDERFWRKYSGHFREKTTLNNVLLENIQYITDELKQVYQIPFATKLVLRIIFIRYLIDRGVDLGYEGFDGEVERGRARLIELCHEKETLYHFFRYLKLHFNGNLFEAENEFEDENLCKEALELLARFLSGKEKMRNGQLAFFNLYDFNIIPVETISNIYEIVLGDKTRREEKAFYTPAFLADYIIQTECSEAPRLGKMLDPACGSGIFLVLYFKKLVERNITREGISDDKLLELMRENIFGVDRNPEAINVAVFSLYLTMLDYKDTKAVAAFKLPNLIGESLFCADFFEDNALMELRSHEFSFIIGNPPWGRIQGQRLHVRYCADHALPQQNEEISRSFLYKVREYCGEYTRCCLILPSKIFYNQEGPARECRQYLLTHVQISSLLEMSSVVDGLFENASAPATVFSFQYREHIVAADAVMKHIALKPTAAFWLFHILSIEKDDIKYVSQQLLLEYDWLWKMLVYGSTGDFENILYLKKRYQTIGERLEKENPKLISYTGVQYNDGEEDACELVGRPFFQPRGNVDHCYIDLSENNFQEFSKEKIFRTRDTRLYKAPYCLLTKGVNPGNYRMRAVCCEDRDFVFPETIYGIKGEKEQTELLYTLAGLFNSSLYAYYNFMVGASAGIDRRQRFVRDVLQFPYPNQGGQRIAECCRELHQLRKEPLQAEGAVEEKLRELDECVLESFNLQGNVYIRYAIEVMIPLITGKRGRALRSESVTLEELYEYGEILKEYFTEIYEPEGKYVSISLFPDLWGGFCAVSLDLSENETKQGIEVSRSGLSAEGMRILQQSYNEMFRKIRDGYFFQENAFIVIKTYNKRNWQPANAYMDLNEITARIIGE